MQISAKPGLTDQQRRALDARGVSVAVSAGAGCGKTFVLTERFLAELEPDGPMARPRLSQVTAITFTERAAREMRDRIRAACDRRLLECPEEQAAYWLELIRGLDSARISTIHAFCGSLLRAHAVEAGLDPRFRVLDAAQSATLLFEQTDDVLRRRLADRDEAALASVVRFGLDSIRAVIARWLNQRQEIDWDAWRGETAEGLVSRWERFFREDAVPRLLRRLGNSAAAQTVLASALASPSTHPAMRERFATLVERIPRLVDSFGRDAAGASIEDLDAIREAATVRGALKKHWNEEFAYETFKNAAESLRKQIDRAAKQLSFDAAAARPDAEAALQLFRLAADAADAYEREKQELAVLDFNDLLIRARRLLIEPERGELRRRLASQMRLLLVDEFQDTDALQVELVKAICDNRHLDGRLFLVGDHKQSVYRFRGADPQVFRRLRADFPASGRLPLSENFRSQPAILDFVNAAFAEELGPDYEPLIAHRLQIAPRPAVEFLWAAEQAASDARAGVEFSDPSYDDMGRRERLCRREADWIARRIRAMLDSGEMLVWDDAAAETGAPAVRAVRLGDVALLFRALTNVEYYEEALARYGIDYYLVGGHAFYAQQEIYDLLNLLRALNSPGDEVSLAGALRSPMFGLYDETLFWLVQRGRGLSEGLFKSDPPAGLDPEQRRRVEFAAAAIRDLRAVKDRLPVAQLIHELLRRTGYDAVLLAEFLGDRKLANLHKLIEQARSFDQSGMFTLSDFITQLAEFVTRQPDEPLAATCPESTDVVKLMTIHQSKGLEFPVVVVPDVGRPRRVSSPPAAFTPALGPMVRGSEAVSGFQLFMAAEEDEERMEISRLLYVAATRAADYLILSSGVEQLGDAKGPWTELLARRFDLLDGVERKSGASATSEAVQKSRGPLVKITTAAPPIRSKLAELRPHRDLLKILEKAKQMAADGAGRQSRYAAPIANDPTARRQFSFSRLTGRLHAHAVEGEAAAWDVEDSPETPLDARELGTLVHDALSEIDFARPPDVAELVRRLALRRPGVPAVALREPVEMIERFLDSPRAAELAAAAELYRELEFLLAWPPGDCTAASKGIYLQGFIDCLYRDAVGRWRIVDYKTNHVVAETLAATASRYEMQMLVYAAAAETALGTPPVELVLCFLRPGLEYHFAWNAVTRRRMMEMIAPLL